MTIFKNAWSQFANLKMWQKVLIVAIAIGIGIAAGGSKPTTQPVAASSAKVTAPTADAGAQLACDHFRNVQSDVSQGLLTDAELRTKLQEVHDSAEVSTNDGIASSATAMLAADTAGDTTALKSAIADFATACIVVGH